MTDSKLYYVALSREQIENIIHEIDSIVYSSGWSEFEVCDFYPTKDENEALDQWGEEMTGIITKLKTAIGG